MDELTPQNLEQLEAFNKCTPKERMFLLQYAMDFNAARAARDSGYSPSTADKQAASWIGKNRESSTKTHLYDAFQEVLDLRARRCFIEATDVLDELAAIAFSNIFDYVTVKEGGGGVELTEKAKLTLRQQAAVAEIQVTPSRYGKSQKVKLHDKLGALDKLGKHFGLFVERHEHSGPGGGPIRLQASPETLEAVRQLVG